MNNFQHIGTFDYKIVLNEVVANPIWNWLNLRQYAGHGKDIVLRYQSVETNLHPMDLYSVLECVDFFSQSMFPKTMQLIKETFPDEEIGRIVIANLAPGEEVKPHRDEGLYSDTTDRYHFVVTTNPDVVSTSGDEQLHMSRGDIYWFNNHIEHSVKNTGTTNRIHLIVDLYHG